jgi:hypothetical protein
MAGRHGPFLDITGGYFPSYETGGPEASVLVQERLPTGCRSTRGETSTACSIGTARTDYFTERGCMYRNGYPKAEMIEFLANGCTLGAPAAAKPLLNVLTPMLDQVPEQDRMPFLVQAADFYLRVDDPEDASSIVQRGFDLARSAYRRDSASETLQKVPPSLWPSAETYRQIVTVGAYASIEQTRKEVDESPDAGLRRFERTMIARALLGVPIRRRIMASGTGTIEADQGWAYDTF